MVRVIKFWAPWCSPCKKYTPVLDSVIESFSDDEVLYQEVNIDDLPNVASQYGVQGIPFTVMEKDGAVVQSFSGPLPPKKIKTMIKELL